MNKIPSYKFLPLTLSIETLGGVATPLVKRGTPLPAVRKQRFSTSSDNQRAISISIFYGESPISKKNILLGELNINDIPEAPKGEVEADIHFEVNDTCQVTVTATTVKLGKIVSSTKNMFKTELTKEKVNEILQKAIDEQQEDHLLAKKIEVKNVANNLIVKAENYLLSQQKSGLRSTLDSQIEDLIANLGLALQDDNISMIEEKSKELEKLIFRTIVELGSFFNTSGDFFEGIFGGQPQKNKTTQSDREKQRFREKTDTEKIARPQEELGDSKKSEDSLGIETIWEAGKIRVFISHRDEKKTEAKKLAFILNSLGVSGFIAHDSIQPMATWKNEIYKALQTMDAFVCFITEDYYDSFWTNQEIGFALAKGVPIILYSHDGTDPKGFKSDIQAIKRDMSKVKLYIKKIFSSRLSIKNNILDNFFKAKDGTFSNAKSQFINLIGLKFTDEEIDGIVRAISGPAKYINQLGVILYDEMSEDDSKIIGYPANTTYRNVLDKEILSQHTEKRYVIIQVDKDRYEIKDGRK